jgi:4-hydroxyproline epimerase
MNDRLKQTVRVIDSHTGGEPTRVVISGGPELGSGTMSERLKVLSEEYDWFRSSVVNEPRGSDVLVGAVLCAPVNSENAAGTIFFNNVGYLGMCGHGSIGLAVTLAHAGRLQAGEHCLETPAGDVVLTLHDPNRVSVCNVPSYRFRSDVKLQVPEIGEVCGDIAWGGNWFYLISDHGQTLDYENVDTLTDYTWAIRRELDAQGVRGANGEFVDHVELFGPPSDPATADSKNFVMCPGKAYDRSPCGTGTSAKIACLIEDENLVSGKVWKQESITGSIFEARACVRQQTIYPIITGTAYITGEASLYYDPSDPFCYGLSPGQQ